MTAVDLFALLERLPRGATLDPATGQVHYANGVRICHHVAQTETLSEAVHKIWRKDRDGDRWTMRRHAVAHTVLTLRCPDCPAFQHHYVPPGMRVTAVLGAYVFPRESA